MMVGRQGLESRGNGRETAELGLNRPSSPVDDHAPTTVSNEATTPVGQRDEGDLERALRLAAEAGQWDVVTLLGRELEARRLAASPNVVALPRRSK